MNKGYIFRKTCGEYSVYADKNIYYKKILLIIFFVFLYAAYAAHFNNEIISYVWIIIIKYFKQIAIKSALNAFMKLRSVDCYFIYLFTFFFNFNNRSCGEDAKINLATFIGAACAVHDSTTVRWKNVLW